MQEMLFLFWTLFLWSNHLAASQGQTIIRAEPGHDVVLPCRSGHDGDIVAVEWIRPDLEPEYVFLYRNGHLDPDHQHPSFQNRVDLQDRQMKDGNVSLILKKVMTNDTGTYVCGVPQRITDTEVPVSFIHLEVSPPEPTNIRAEPGHDVSLPCRTGHDGDILAVEWTRPDLEPEDVFLYTSNESHDKGNQHPSDQNRVDLQDRQMKDGDVSLILKNLTTNDTGTYKCRVYQRGTYTMLTVSFIRLEVKGTTQDGRNQDGGDKDGNSGGHHGLIVGLSAAGIIMMVVGFWIYRRLQKKNPPPPPDQNLLPPPPPDQSLLPPPPDLL